jgi:plasmid stabilization system protein ParE
MRVRFVPEADEELSEATAYLNERSKQAAQRFLADVDRAIQLLLQFPRLGSPLVNDLRGFSLRVFPYRLIYRVEGEIVRIYAVAHVRRRRGYWRRRIPK